MVETLGATKTVEKEHTVAWDQLPVRLIELVVRGLVYKLSHWSAKVTNQCNTRYGLAPRLKPSHNSRAFWYMHGTWCCRSVPGADIQFRQNRAKIFYCGLPPVCLLPAVRLLNLFRLSVS